MLSRPLPATPTEDRKSKRSRGKGQKEGRKSGIFGEKSDDHSMQGTSSRSTNGFGLSRPQSVQYQNDSPLHYGRNSDVMDGMDTLYQGGPPTPRR